MYKKKLFRYIQKPIFLGIGFFLILSCRQFISQPKHKQINTAFLPGKIWYDTDSLHINAHGGGILFHQGTYYWFGEHKTAGKSGNTALIGINCYSSKDLYNWKNEGIALAAVDDTNSEITKGCIMERPKVLYNESTNKFVMWFHLELKHQGYKTAKTAVAISDNPTGPYTFLRSFRPNKGQWPYRAPEGLENMKFNYFAQHWTPEWKQAITEGLYVQRDFDEGQMSRDMTLFVDEGGKAYHIHASEENLTLHISELTSDYLGFTGKWSRIFPLGHNEAPAMFKYNHKYYLITSGCTGWDPNAARSAVADSIYGPWKALGNPCIGENADITFNAQSTAILQVEGTKGGFIFMADRWDPKNPIDGRYIWLPLIMENERPIIKWHDKWDLSEFNAYNKNLN